MQPSFSEMLVEAEVRIHKLEMALREIARLATQQYDPILSVIEETARRALNK